MLVTASDILLAVYQVCLVLFRNISNEKKTRGSRWGKHCSL